MGWTLARIDVDGEGDREAAHGAVWEATTRFVRAYAADATYAACWRYLDGAIDAALEAGLWGVGDEGALVFGFSNFAGCGSRSASAWHHWVTLAWAALGDDLEERLDRHGLAARGLPTLATALDDRARFVRARGAIWSVDNEGLYGDDQYISLDQLDPDEREAARRADERCACDPCQMLRPEPAFEAEMARSLASDDEDTRETAAWYARYMARPSRSMIEALVRHGPAAEGDAFRRAVRALAPRCVEARDALAATPAPEGGQWAVRLAGRDALADTDASLVPGLVDEALEALGATSPPLVCAAAAALGRHGRERRGEAAGAMARALASAGDAEARHELVLGLVNVHLPNFPFCEAVRAGLARQALGDDDVGQLARWALASLP